MYLPIFKWHLFEEKDRRDVAHEKDVRQAPDDTLFRATTHRETGTRRTDDGTRTLARVRLRLTWPTVGP